MRAQHTVRVFQGMVPTFFGRRSRIGRRAYRMGGVDRNASLRERLEAAHDFARQLVEHSHQLTEEHRRLRRQHNSALKDMSRAA